MLKFVKLGASGLALMPFLALAQNDGILNDPTGSNLLVTKVITNISVIIGYISVLIIALAVVFFIWNLLKYIRKSGEEQTEARNAMIWGIIIIAVMVSIWGLVSFLQDAVGVEEGAEAQVPQIPAGYSPSGS